MSVKHDRTYARTAQDIERKYSFGKTFAEMLGLINDNRDKVDSVESYLYDGDKKSATTLKRDTKKIVAEATKEISDDVNELSSKVELKMDAEQVNIAIEQQMANGVDRVVTKTGYTFDTDGLKISKDNSGITNKIDNTGMYVTQNEQEILTANTGGVNATNLHAKTYLIIGKGDGRSRFEDYLTTRTGCFWIGG